MVAAGIAHDVYRDYLWLATSDPSLAVLRLLPMSGAEAGKPWTRKVFHVKQSPIADLTDALADLEGRDLLRRPRLVPDGAVNLCSNDYLGLAARPVTASSGTATGAGASRLVSGHTPAHASLEHELAAWLKVDSTLTFTSGYAANVGALSALVRPGDRVLSDALNHASIIDGLRLSRGTVEIYPHLDAQAVERALTSGPAVRTWVVTESYFSMDADVPDLARLRAMCDASGAALYVDEAHALGVYGPEGRGLCASKGFVPDVIVGTLGKSFGLGGAFVGGSAAVTRWLWNRARSFVFSTGISPLLVAEAEQRLPSIRQADLERSELLANADFLRNGLRALGCRVVGDGPVVPWVIGDPGRTVALANELQERGFFVQAIRPPTVPDGAARLRLAVGAHHSRETLQRFLHTVREVKESWVDWSS